MTPSDTSQTKNYLYLSHLHEISQILYNTNHIVKHMLQPCFFNSREETDFPPEDDIKKKNLNTFAE